MMANRFNVDLARDTTKSPLCDISWTSSESEQEYETPNKRKKMDRADSWIKPLIPHEFRISTKEAEYPVYNIEESPIIGTLPLDEMSPVLVETNSIDTFLEKSPVISNLHRLKTVRSKYMKFKGRQKVSLTPERSPDLFPSEATQVIESESPECPQQKTIYHISQSSDCQASSSQSSDSKMMRDSVTSDSPKTDSSSLYHQPVSRRKKRYKKGGLASQLQKTLQLQRSRISIWQHELFTKKSDILDWEGKGEIIEFVVENIQQEYGSLLLECILSQPKDFVDIIEPLECNDHSELFIIVVGDLVNINFLKGAKYQMFPPFHIKTVSHKSTQVKCYFGVNKITVSKQ